ncbi:MAG: TetR/AcrR family transcriptional regulator [Oscillospiraceae bacterium]
MEEEKVDRRVRKTKKQLRLALTALMMDKSTSEITVREIAELADVNRGTFYAHYNDVSDLLSQLEEHVFFRLEEISVKDEAADSEEALYRYLRDVLALCRDYADIYRALVCRNNDLAFQHRLFKALESQYLRGFLSKHCRADEKSLDFYCSFIVSGMLSITRDWMNSGLSETPEELAALGTAFIFRGLPTT